MQGAPVLASGGAWRLCGREVSTFYIVVVYYMVMQTISIKQKLCAGTWNLGFIAIYGRKWNPS